LAFERGAIRLSGAAPEIFHVISTHGIMVAQLSPRRERRRALPE
jgi:hypothetical protein